MKKRGWKKCCLSVILSAMLAFGSWIGSIPAMAQAAEPDVTFTVNADKTQVQRGDTVTVSVDMSGNVRGGGLELLLAYDKEKLECTEDDLVFGEVFDELSRGDISDLAIGTEGIKAVIGRKKDAVANGHLFSAQFKVKENAKGNLGFKVSALMVDKDDPKQEVGSVCDSSRVEGMDVYIPVTGITLEQKKINLNRGDSQKLSAVVNPADADQTIKWSSDNEAVAKVSADGTVQAVGKGTANITASAGNFTATCQVTVRVPLESISISAQDDRSTIKKGQTLQLALNYTPQDADMESAVEWSSSKKEIATVNANGLVTALADGVTTITAKVGDKKATYDVTVKEVKLESIQITKEKTTIHKGEKEKLEVKYNPADTTDDRTVTWSSTNTSIASVDGSGEVTAVKPGQVIIKAQVGNFTSECEVTVDAPLKEIVPSAETLDMVKKQTAQLTWTLNPTDTTDSREVSLESSEPSVAAVEKDGTVTAKKAGTAIITLTGANNVKAFVTVHVTEIAISGISLNIQSKTVEKLDTFELKAVIAPSDNTDDDQTITWKSSDPSIVTVDADKDDSSKAVVRATEKGGTATITAMAWNGVKTECTIKVLKHVEKIELPKNVIVRRGNTMILNPEIFPMDTDDTLTFSWASSDPKVASIDEKTGMITPKKAGTAEITLTAHITPAAVSESRAVFFAAGTVDQLIAKETITVEEIHLTDETMKDIVLSDMKEAVLRHQSFDMNTLLNLREMIKEEEVTDDIFVDWSVDDETVASIDQSGFLLGLKEGKVKVTAVITAADGSGSKKSCTVSTWVNVKEIPLESIAFDKVIAEMQTGATEILHVLYSPKDTTDDLDVSWSSSDESTISVENGKLTAKKAGIAVITAKVGDKTVSCTITVKDAPKAGQNETAGNQSGPAAPKTGSFGAEGILLIIGISIVLLLVVFLESNRKRKIRR